MRSSTPTARISFQEIVIQVWRSVDALRGEIVCATRMLPRRLNTAIAWRRTGISGADGASVPSPLG
jgi:hypothetical protein